MPLRRFRAASHRGQDSANHGQRQAPPRRSPARCDNPPRAAAFKRGLHERRNGGKSEAAGKKFRDRDLVGGVQHGRRRTARLQRRRGRAAERGKPLQIGRLEGQTRDLGQIEPRAPVRGSGPARPGNARSGCACRAAPSCAIIEPSRNSTMPCTIDCGCTSTSISLGRHREQMMRLDQFEALVHQGRGIDRDLRAHRPVRMLAAPVAASPPRTASTLQVRNGPPDAVRITRRTSRRAARRSAPETARCARNRPAARSRRCAAARRMNSAPAQTRHSLLASATVAPRSTAASVGRKPAAPVIAAITQSAGRAAPLRPRPRRRRRPRCREPASASFSSR